MKEIKEKAAELLKQPKLIEDFVKGEMQFNPFIDAPHAINMINAMLDEMINGGHGSFVRHAAKRNWSGAMGSADHSNLKMIYIYEKFHVNYTNVPSMDEVITRMGWELDGARGIPQQGQF